MAVDPLAEEAPDWTPYRYGFNNPLTYTDPDGMFESEDAAKAWAKDNDIKTGWFSGNRIRENSDGTWSIDNRRDHTSVSDLGGDLGVMTALMVSDEDIISTELEGEFGPLGLYDTRRLVNTHRDGTQSESPFYIGGTTPASRKGKGILNPILKIEKIARRLLNKPETPGNAPTFKKDGTSVEIHHVNQDPKGPFKEMHWKDHRGKGNHKKNHPNKNSKIDRKDFDKAKREYWRRVFDNWENGG